MRATRLPSETHATLGTLGALAALVALAGCPARPAASDAGPGGPSTSAKAVPPGSGAPRQGPAASREGPDGGIDPGTARLARGVITNSCVACHDELMLRQQRLTPAQWKAVVEKMHRWGAPLEPRESAALIAFASARYHPGTGPHRAPALSAAEVDAQLNPLPDGPFAGGDAAAGAKLFDEACATCHGKEATGTELGLNLVDRPVLYRAAELAAVVRQGRGRMPALPATDAQVAGLLAHLRTLPTDAPVDGAPAPPR